MAQAVVLAGGLATRMLPRTADVPKFLLPVRDRPFAAWLLERLAGAGFSHVLLCIGHLGAAIRDAIGDGSAFGLRVDYADEGESQLGTAGALRGALGELESAFLVTYGDSYLPFDYAAPLRDLLAHDGARGTMAVYRNRDRYDASNAEVHGDRVVRYEKRSVNAPRDPGLEYIDYGATALRRDVVEAMADGARGGLDAVQARLAAEGTLRAFVAERRFFEIGSAAGLRDLEAELASAYVRTP